MTLWVGTNGFRSVIAKREQGLLYHLLRSKKGWSQRQVGELLGVSQPSIAHRERNRATYSCSELVMLKTMFGLSVEELWSVIETIANHPKL